MVFTVFKLRFPWQAIGCASLHSLQSDAAWPEYNHTGTKIAEWTPDPVEAKICLGESSMIQSKKKRLRLEVAAQKRCQHPIKHEFSISKCISGQLQVNKNLSSRALPWFLANNDIHVEKGVDLDLP